jgi:hypothetical protein
MATKAERLVEFFRRLAAAAPADTAEAALALIRDTLNAVEDELSGVDYDADLATMQMPSARMYPPLPDSERPSIIRDTRCFRARFHDIFVANNGAFMIRHHHSLRVELSKPGADGNEVTP